MSGREMVLDGLIIAGIALVMLYGIAFGLKWFNGPAEGNVTTASSCYARAAAEYYGAGVAALRGEEEGAVVARVARAVAFDPELAELWRRAQVDETAWASFALLLQEKAWGEQQGLTTAGICDKIGRSI